jgi:ABC-type nitrate/sulfonate/bicarbonate transport system substrate-binding protein
MALIVVVVVLAAQTKRSPPAPRPSQFTITPANVSMWFPSAFNPGFAGELVALKAGLFEQEGLNVKLHAGDARADPLSSVTGDDDAIGVVGAERFLTARAKGVPVVAFAAAFLKSTVVFYALERSDIRSPFDFLGRRVGYQPGQETAIIYEAMMNRLQVARSKVQEIRVGADISPLLDGRVEVLPGHVGAEAYTLTNNGIGYQVVSPLDYGLNVPGTVYFTSEHMIRNHPDTVRRFLRAVIAGWELTYSDERRSVPMIVANDAAALNSKMVSFQLEQQRDRLRPSGVRIGDFDETQWRLLQSILIQQRLITNPIDLADAITFEFLRDAYRIHPPGSAVSQ